MKEEAIFHQVLEQAAPQREAFLNAACGADPELRERVAVLLRAEANPGSFLQSPAVGVLPTIDQSPSESPGTRIGPYKLLEQIGEGGMGVVYVAEQTEPVRRRVALKIIKPGMDTKQVIARFEAERQALAMMDHPNIAKILDAGTVGGQEVRDQRSEIGKERTNLTSDLRPLTSGSRPYFVMELVRGLPVTEYCDKARLSPRQRLGLFIDVCHAVQHAHQKGVIHRDLKPSNVMITVHDGRPVAKVIDFGVAKAVGQQLTERTVYTAHTQLVGTPLYMSPEQADFSSQDVDTRSDVYSLGVLLYELLTGQTPFDKETLAKAGLDEMRRIIREDEPPSPSRRFSTLSAQAISTVSQHRSVDERHLGRVLRGELDWIVMKALEKDRSRRYESASALAADIRRYLSDEPVLACPPTTMYRFQKFARKHKPALFTAAAIALCLLLGTTVSAWQAVRATTAEAKANANKQEALVNEQQANANAEQAKEKAIEATAQRDEAQKQRDEVKALADKLAAKEEQLQQTLYADHIYMAKEAWDAGNVDRATSLLKRHLPQAGESDRRGFEWHYLNRLLSASPLHSFQTASNLLTLSPDRTRLIMLKSGRTEVREGQRVTIAPELQVWNLQTGQQELTAPLQGAPDRFFQQRPIFSPDAKWLVTRGRGDASAQANFAGEVKVWDTKDGKLVLSIGSVDEDDEGRAFSPDGNLLVTAMADQSVKIWDLQTGQERWTFKGQLDWPHAFAFSPDGKRLAAAGNKWDDAKDVAVAGEIKIWDVKTGELVQTLEGHKEWMESLVFSPDGQLLATTDDSGGAIKLWDTHTGNELRTLPTGPVWIPWIQFNASGDRLIGLTAKKVNEKWESYTTMWNTQTGQELLKWNYVGGQFSPDGKCIAFSDSSNSSTKVFDAESGKIMLTVKNAGRAVAFSPDSKRLATDSGGVRIWDLETGEEINHIKGFIGDSMLAFSRDGKHLIGGSRQTVQVWDAEVEQRSAKKLLLPGVQQNPGVPLGFSSPAVISSDFTRIAGISGKTAKLFDANTGQELRTFKVLEDTGREDTGRENPGRGNYVLCVAISHDGKRVAASAGQGFFNTAGGTVKVWNAETGKELSTIAGLAHCMFLLKFSPDGQKLAGTPADLTITVWDAGSGRELYGLGTRPPSFNNTTTSVASFAFSPDGKRLAWRGAIWDAETGKRLATPKDAKGAVRQGDITAFSPDGNRVLVKNGVWDAATGERLSTIDKMVRPTFSPDGKRLADGRKIWDAQTGLELLSLSQEDNIGQVAFSPDGHRLAVVKAWMGEVTIYDATPLPEKP